MGLCSSYPNDAIGQQSSAESALSEGRHTSPECNCPRKSLWHGQSGHQHHQRLLSIQKKDLIPANRTKVAWRILHLGCPVPGEPNYGGLQIVPSIVGYRLAERPYPAPEMLKRLLVSRPIPRHG